MMAAASLNPFRNHSLNSQGTGSSFQSSNPSATMNGATDTNDLVAAISEEPPPAYTPIADPYQGEAAVEFGPRRPFQPAPPPAAALFPIPGPAQLQPRLEFAPPAPAAPFPPPSSPRPAQSQTRLEFLPPPRHPSTTNLRQTRTPSSSSTSLTPPRHPSITRSRTQPRSASSLSESESSARSYNPPAGLPPSAQSFRPPPDPHPAVRSFSPPPPRPAPPPSGHCASTPGTVSGTSTVLNDGRPTTEPTPGHPLLRGGKLLVYPPGFECPKCHNTGFKNNDPSHACGKCWDKYARSYTGALAYAPFPSSNSSSSSGSGSNFQRPLPVFRPPQHSHTVSDYPPMLPRTRSGQSHLRKHRHSPPPHHIPQHHQPAAHHPPSAPPFRNAYAPPPPQMHPPPPPIIHQPPPHIIQGPAPIYAPGDPRIGGRLCWRCSGRGGVSFLFFDWESCSVCKGVGRVFN